MRQSPVADGEQCGGLRRRLLGTGVDTHADADPAHLALPALLLLVSAQDRLHF